MKVIFVTGTAGAGKSLLTSKIKEYYAKNSSFAVTLNLDPGVGKLPYSPDVDVRDYVDLNSLMEQYELGSNGSLIMANDLIATKIDDIQNTGETASAAEYESLSSKKQWNKERIAPAKL